MKFIHRLHKQRWIVVSVIVGMWLIEVAAAQGDNRVGLVVVHDNGATLTRCIVFPEEEITGFQVLDRAYRDYGLDLNYEASQGGTGAAICRIDNQGCSYPEDSCFCECEDLPCRFWSYWYWDKESEDWVYSPLGAGNRSAKDGDLEAWVWNTGSSLQAPEVDSTPPVMAFDDICTPPPTETSTLTVTDTPTETPISANTATPTGTPTATRTPTSEPSPTGTVTPTETPTVLTLPTINQFSVDRGQVNFGETINLSWDVANAERVVLHINGQQEAVAAQGTRADVPNRTTTYVLTAHNQGGEMGAEVSVVVNPVISAPTSAPAEPTPLPTDTAVPTDTPLPPTETITATATETETPMPTQTPLPLPTETPLPTSTLTGTPIPTDTPTPLPVAVENSNGGTGSKVVLPASPSDAAISADDDRLQRVMVIGGVLFVVGVPLLFAGIWLVVYSLWNRE